MGGPRYRIELADPSAHRYRVTLTLASPAAEQDFSLPVWIPGSYMVREFAKHLSRLSARQGGRELGIEQLDKASWRVRCQGRAALVLSYEVYAFDASVRTAWLDGQRAFFNPSSLCLRAHGREGEPHRIDLARLPKGWQVATEMVAADGGFEAVSYDELLDHPFEIGPHWTGEFVACGVTHRIVVAGAWPSFDGERLLADVRHICEAQIAFWEEGSKAPFERYSFLLWAVDDGHGGLEHRASTALICARRELPTADEPATPGDHYARLLGLFSHEYFHAWNVKRLKPAEFASLDYQRENYTELLWFFEGFTSYYDELMLLRAGRVDAPRYLKLLAASVNGVLATPGRRVQPLSTASFEAWTKYYRPDENSPNATSNYYAQGALVALCLDLSLRARQSSLDALMRRLWAGGAGGALSEADIFAAVQALGGGELATRLSAWVHGTDELPLRELLETHGIAWRDEGRQSVAQRLGLRVRETALTGVGVTHVLAGGAAEAVGLNARDEILGCNGWRLRRLDDAPGLLAPGDTRLRLLVGRDQRLFELDVELPPARPASVALALADGEPMLRRCWLGT
ncbi:M61 family metallopeptidase [Roseateles saccharophilus]|uniref:Putative metalloprotease with PDZ domain n=1 Tax=Roseateles saccharophilus TaxID=304 RepID=A0A4R3U9Y1_ROSSA|nr:PDZ domain-containing protein [Roseateles saccharophilus]MDG0835708.1 M61 family peptidase [Roseateles saccharophilus]TCU84063.1 putative metalloprotease with PDZ domain [Roseateles saccharophilus]